MDDHELRLLSSRRDQPNNSVSSVSHASDWAHDVSSSISRISGENDSSQKYHGHEMEHIPFIDTAYDPGKDHQDHGQDQKSDSRKARVARFSRASGQSYKWLPFTLRLPYLIVLLVLTTVLGVATLFLTIYSARNHGIGNNDGSSSLLFGWRFSPTLIAVIYSISVGTMLSNCRRTEIFARLARRDGATAEFTLCFPSRAWWNDPFDALSKVKNNGVRSWALFLASIANILAFLVISPLSAGLLVPVTVNIPRDTGFKQMGTSNLDLQMDIADSIMFRTISGSILNTSTSAWITNDFAILPFWPSNLPTAPLAASFSNAQDSQQWTGWTTVYQATMDCSDVSLKDMHNTTAVQVGVSKLNSTGSLYANENMTAISLASSDGCSINIYEALPSSSQTDYLSNGGGWWLSSPGSIPGTAPTISNNTGNCGNRSFLAYNTPWKFNQPLVMKGHLCSTKYLEGNVSVTVSITESSTNISFASSEFDKVKTTMDPSKYHLRDFETSFFTSNWTKKFVSGSVSSTVRLSPPWYTGPILAIAASYNNSAQRMLDSSTLVDEARRFKQQYLGQMLLSGMDANGLESSANIAGTVNVSEQRIAVVLGIGATLGALFLISSICILGVLFFTRLSRRPLKLSHDPGSIAAAASLIAEDVHTRATFEGSERLSMRKIKERLDRVVYSVNDGTLVTNTAGLETTGSIRSSNGGFSMNHMDDQTVQQQPWRDQQPILLRGWMGPLFLSFLLALVGALVALYITSIRGGLIQKALVYQFNFTIASSLTTFAPYSIIPTVFAVAVKLWFGAIEETFRRLQPFAAMSRTPAPVSQSVQVAYGGIPAVVTPIKALRNSHWLLALVGLGAIGTEIFTVSISALWNRENHSSTNPLTFSRSLELRAVPQVYSVGRTGAGYHQDQAGPAVMASVYGNYITSWLYGATVEMTQGASTPAWTKDEWSFVPINFSSSAATISALLSNKTAPSLLQDLPYNITVETPALRARLVCKNVDYVSNTSLWSTKWDFNNKTMDLKTNKTMWNSTNRPANLDFGYELSPDLTNPYAQYSAVSIGAGPGYFSCCSNITNGEPGEAAIGYWTSNSTFYPQFKQSMVAKWVVGSPLDGMYNDSSRDATQGSSISIGQHWIWTEQPQMVAVSCEPVIEEANASVLVDLNAGLIRNYTILGAPMNATGAWSDHYLGRNQSKDYVGAMTYAGGLEISQNMNMTSSYGYVFFDALLNAANVAMYGNEFQRSYNEQNPADHAFNFRVRGLNMDFMSYSMLALANNDKQALLDPNTYIEKANVAFGTFFKHYVSENVTMEDGGLAFQPIGATLPSTLGPVVSGNLTAHDGYNGSLKSTTPLTANATLHMPIERLIMSTLAVYLCLAILAFLCLTIAIIYGFYRNRFKALPRDVDTLASVLGFVYASERLLEWAREGKYAEEIGGKVSGDRDRMIMARLGPFENSGRKRWGVELVDEGEVEHLSGPNG